MLRQVSCIISKPLVKSNWRYSPGTPNSGQNWWFFCPMWPRNLTDDLEKQQGTYPIPHQASCIISSPNVNSNWSYGPETAKLDFDLCDLELWPWSFAWTSFLSIAGTLLKRRDSQTDRETDRQSDRQTDGLNHSYKVRHMPFGAAIKWAIVRRFPDRLASRKWIFECEIKF